MPPAALDRTPLLAAVERLADRYRSLPASRLRSGAAAEGLALARALSAEAQWLECPAHEPRMMPDDGVLAVGDQIAVAGHDLAAALADYPDRPGRAAILARALRLIERASTTSRPG